MQCFADISAINRENKARYSSTIVCITFALYCIKGIGSLKNKEKFLEQQSRRALSRHGTKWMESNCNKQCHRHHLDTDKNCSSCYEANNLRDEELWAEPVSTPKPPKQQKVAMVDENVKRTLNIHCQLVKINQTLQSLKDISNKTTKKKAKIMQAEDPARSVMVEQKLAQESRGRLSKTNKSALD